MDIKGMGALVTGGASGLGEATVRMLAEAGARVTILDVPRSQGEALAAQLGDAVAFAPADVTDEEQVRAAVTRSVEHAGAVHIVVNCAGIGMAMRTVGREGPHNLAIFNRVIQVNLVGTFNVIRLAANLMQHNAPNSEGERGVIVNTASVAAFDGQIGQAAYSASKAGVVGMTLPIAREFGRFGIRVMTIAPGIFETPMLGALNAEAREALVKDAVFPGRLGRPSEYALLVRQIVENPMLNGETIRLDGGLRMPPR
ncbi:MAG TPA: 3-hydroxyacyl-CoA dehydrogenase [Dehalococcoidia bacterium]|nr:3-hydroxyacyl-CoA dehydrogenase [Dehalococcoidia bacterium]